MARDLEFRIQELMIYVAKTKALIMQLRVCFLQMQKAGFLTTWLISDCTRRQTNRSPVVRKAVSGVFDQDKTNRHSQLQASKRLGMLNMNLKCMIAIQAVNNKCTDQTVRMFRPICAYISCKICLKEIFP